VEKKSIGTAKFNNRYNLSCKWVAKWSLRAYKYYSRIIHSLPTKRGKNDRML